MSTSQLQSAFDFVNGAVGYRFRSGASRKDALARAAGFGKGTVPTIIDATAGLGRDAFHARRASARRSRCWSDPPEFTTCCATRWRGPAPRAPNSPPWWRG